MLSINQYVIDCMVCKIIIRKKVLWVNLKLREKFTLRNLNLEKREIMEFVGE